jgi:hypothetical protein
LDCYRVDNVRKGYGKGVTGISPGSQFGTKTTERTEKAEKAERTER